MVKRKQFDDFYFIKDGKIHTLDEVQEQYEKTMEIYLIFKDVWDVQNVKKPYYLLHVKHQGVVNTYQKNLVLVI